jgi:hypothetical protein
LLKLREGFSARGGVCIYLGRLHVQSNCWFQCKVSGKLWKELMELCFHTLTHQFCLQGSLHSHIPILSHLKELLCYLYTQKLTTITNPIAWTKTQQYPKQQPSTPRHLHSRFTCSCSSRSNQIKRPAQYQSPKFPDQCLFKISRTLSILIAGLIGVV